MAIADHIWNAFELMAVEMGADRDGLVNQAMFMFARLNGFLEAGRPAPEEAPAAEAPRARAAAAMLDDEPAPPPRRPAAARPPPVHDFDDAPAPADLHGHDEPVEQEQEEHAAAGEEDETGFEEPQDRTPLPAPTPPPPRRPAGPNGPSRPPARLEAPVEPPVVEPRRRMTELAPSIDGFDGPPAAKLDDDPVRREVAERVLETAAELERLIKGKQQGAAAAEPPPPRPDPTNVGAAPAEKGLFFVIENGDTEKVAKERYLIGRGKHCDFVINSGKVSREHAAILKEGPEYFIEDLGSSNGTWFNKARIKRRKIEDGDEYFICSEKIKFVVR